MRKKLSLWIKIPLALFTLFVGSLFAIYTFRAEILGYAERRLGVRVSLREARLLDGQSPGIELEGLAIESDTHQLRSFTADKLRVIFEPVSWEEVLRADVRVEEIMIKNPDLLLVSPEKKRAKKSGKTKLATSNKGEVFLPLAARNFLIKDGRITVMTARGDKQISCKYNITGHMEKITGYSPDKLNANITFSVRDGFIREPVVLSKIFLLLNPSAFVDITDSSKEGFVFTSFDGSLTIENGVGTLEKTILKSAALNITAGGILDFVKEEMDLDVHVQPLQTIDKAVSWAPVIGRILKGKDRGVVEVHFKVKGKMDDPKVESKQLSNLADQIFGIMKRTLTLPTKLLPDQTDPKRGAPEGK